MYRLYLVGDKKYSFEKTCEALSEDVEYFQLRLKDVSDEEFLKEAKRYKDICQKRDIKFIINDNLDIAIKVKADGLHIGQDDLSLQEVKKRFSGIVGVSCRTLDEAQEAKKDGADYIGVGAVFKTTTKEGAKIIGLDALKLIVQKVDIKVVAIGGIDEKNFRLVYEVGADMLAVSSAVLGAKDPKEILKTLRSKT